MVQKVSCLLFGGFFVFCLGTELGGFWVVLVAPDAKETARRVGAVSGALSDLYWDLYGGWLLASLGGVGWHWAGLRLVRFLSRSDAGCRWRARWGTTVLAYFISRVSRVQLPPPLLNASNKPNATYVSSRSSTGTAHAGSPRLLHGSRPRSRQQITTRFHREAELSLLRARAELG